MPAPIDIGPATLFNTFKADLLGRLTSFCNFIIVVSGGILSLTIGAFINTSRLPIGIESLARIRIGWILLTASLVLALLVPFVLLIAQSVVSWKWQTWLETPKTEDQAGLQLFKNPNYMRNAITAAITLAFASCAGGIIFVSAGAIGLLRLPG